jgi:hypothetical protein
LRSLVFLLWCVIFLLRQPVHFGVLGLIHYGRLSKQIRILRDWPLRAIVIGEQLKSVRVWMLCWSGGKSYPFITEGCSCLRSWSVWLHVRVVLLWTRWKAIHGLGACRQTGSTTLLIPQMHVCQWLMLRWSDYMAAATLRSIACMLALSLSSGTCDFRKHHSHWE